MRHSTITRFLPLTLTVVLSVPAATGCDIEDDMLMDAVAEDTTVPTADHVTLPPSTIPTGSQWGPCDLANIQDPGWWGCDGGPGFGLACARPASDDGLNICVPQTWDPAVDSDCGNVVAPFGLGVRVQGSAYCVADCLSDADCPGGMACAPSSGMCAWIGE